MTPEVAAAWDEVYWLFAAQLIAQEARLYQQAGVDPAHPVRPYRVVRRIEETDDVDVVGAGAGRRRCAAGDRPGAVRLGVRGPAGRASGSPASTRSPRPRSATRLQITVRRVRGVNGAPDGRVSSYLHDQSRSGTCWTSARRPATSSSRPSDGPLLLASAGAGITTVLPIVEHIARTQPQRKVIVAHADRTAQDHALRETVLHVGRQIDDFTAYTWYETVDPADHRSAQGFMDLSGVPLPRGRPGVHLRAAAVHAARAVHPARAGRAGVLHPVRGVRARPVVAPGLTRGGPLTDFVLPDR